MALASTVWPDEPVPDGVKAWLSGFFSTSDMNVPDGPEKVASFFTDEAFLCTSGGTAIGRAEIAASRATAWDRIATREHQVLRVYISKRDYTDILLVCKLNAKYNNGNDLSEEFAARVAFEVLGDGQVKAILYQVWADSAPYRKAMMAE